MNWISFLAVALLFALPGNIYGSNLEEEAGIIEINLNYSQTILALDHHELFDCMQLYFGDYETDSYDFTAFKSCIKNIKDDKLRLFSGNIELEHLNALASLLEACSAVDYSEDQISKILSSEQLLEPFKHFVPESGVRENTNFIEFALQRLDLDTTRKVKNLEILLKLGFDPNESNPTALSSPLGFACAQNMQSCAQILLKYGANVNCFDTFAFTPLLSACFSGNLSLINLLLKYGSKIFQVSDFEAFLRESVGVDKIAASEYIDQLKHDNILVKFHPIDYVSIRDIIVNSNTKAQLEIVKDLAPEKQVETAYEFGLIDQLRVLLGDFKGNTKFKYLNKFRTKDLKYKSQYESFLLAISILDRNIFMIKALKLIRTEAEFRSLVNASFISEHFIDSLETFNSNYQFKLRRHTCSNAGSLPIKLASWIGDYEIVKYLIDNGASTIDVYTVRLGVNSGNLEIVKLMHENSFTDWPHEIFETAVKTSNIEIIAFLMKHRNFSWTESTQKMAIELGLEHFLYTFNAKYLTSLNIGHAAKNGKFEMVKHFLDLGVVLDSSDFFVYENTSNSNSDLFDSVRSFIDSQSDSRVSYFHYKSVASFEIMILLLDSRVTKWFDQEVLNLFSLAGRADLIKLVIEKFGKLHSEYFVNQAAEDGFPSLLQDLLDLGYTYTESAMRFAAARGNMEVIRLLLSRNLPSDIFAIDLAAQNGHLDVLKTLLPSFTGDVSSLSVGQTVENGQVATFKYLVESGTKCVSIHLETAIIKRHHDLVLFLLDKNVNITYKAFMYAAIVGDLSVIKRIFEIDIAGTLSRSRMGAILENILLYAILYGQFRVIQFLFELETISESFEQVFKFDRNAKRQFSDTDSKNIFVAVKNNVEITEYLLLEKNFYCDSEAILTACSDGFHDIVTIFMKKRLSFPEDSLLKASENGHFRVVQLLLQYKEELYSPEAFDAAAKNGHLEIVKLFVRERKGCKDSALAQAAAYGHLDIVEILLTYDFQITTSTSTLMLEKAIKNRHYEVATLLLQNLHHFETEIVLPETVISQACFSGHLELVELIITKIPSFEADLARYAAFKGHYKLIELFIKLGGKVSPLFYTEAAKGGQVEILRLLFERTSMASEGHDRLFRRI